MERLADAAGSFLAAQLGLDADRQEVVTYGALLLLQNGTTLLLTLLLALITDLLPETLIVLGVAATLRHSSGGAHLSTPWRCAWGTTFLVWLCALAGAALETQMSAWILPVRLLISAAWAAACYAAVWKYAPVEAENRPLSPAHRVRVRRMSLYTGVVLVLLLTLGAATNAWWTGAVQLGFSLQALNLTAAGRKFVAHAELLFNQFQRR